MRVRSIFFHNTTFINVSLKILSKYYKYTVFFWLLEKMWDSGIFASKNNSDFDNVVDMYLTS